MTQPSPALRPARESDVTALATLWTETFPGSRSSDERMRELREGMAYGTLDDCRVLEIDGRLAAALRAYPLELHLWGHRYPTVGLAGVAVAADFRRRGLGRRICLEALREAREKGSALSLLYPFRVSFYASLGHVLAGELHQYRFRTADLPLHAGWERVERGGDAGLDEAKRVYARVARRGNGLLERKPGHWRSLRAPGIDLYLHRDASGDATGYVFVQRGRTGARARLRVRELLWEDETSYLALLGWISAQRDQYPWAIHDAFPGEHFERQLPHPRREGSTRPRGLWFESARLLRGPMLRVLDVGAVLSEGRGDASLAVTDPDLPANSGVWRDGRRVSERAPRDALAIDEVARRFLEGELGGQRLPGQGWTPVAGLLDFRLLDEF